MPGHTEWPPGSSGNPNGRPVGKRDNKYRKYQIAAEEENLPDPVIFMHRKLQDESIDLSLRAQMAANLSPYYYPKWGTTSPPPAPIYNEHPFILPPPTTVEQAKENILTLIAKLANSEVDQATYDRLIAGNVAMINALLGQEKLSYAHGDTRDQTIRILGGLEPLPGTNISMPPRVVNGKATYDLLEHGNPSSIDGVHEAVPSTPTDSIPGPETKAPEPPT